MRLTVLDFTDGNVYHYPYKESKVLSVEDFIIERGHSLSNVEYMTHKNSIVYEK
jgi:hypothetical protein